MTYFAATLGVSRSHLSATLDRPARPWASKLSEKDEALHSRIRPIVDAMLARVQAFHFKGTQVAKTGTASNKPSTPEPKCLIFEQDLREPLSVAWDNKGRMVLGPRGGLRSTSC